MPAVETKIWESLKNRVAELSYPIAWPAELFTPPQNSTSKLPYVRVAQVSVAPESTLIARNRPHLRTGSLTVTLVHPISSSTKFSRYQELAGQIADHFADGTNMRFMNVCVTVDGAPHVSDGYEDAGYWNTPVIISWRTFA